MTQMQNIDFKLGTEYVAMQQAHMNGLNLAIDYVLNMPTIIKQTMDHWDKVAAKEAKDETS